MGSLFLPYPPPTPAHPPAPMTKRKASELAVVGASSDARFGERQSAHQRECARFVSVRDRQTGSGMAFRSGDLTDTSR